MGRLQALCKEGDARIELNDTIPMPDKKKNPLVFVMLTLFI